MHILIGLLTAIATLLFALEKLGVDIGWLNPWAWKRRRRWIKQLSVNPAFNIDSPMEAAALLALATARIDGDLSSEEKTTLRSLFEHEFKQTPENASSLLRSSTYLLAGGEEVFSHPEKVLERSIDAFTAEQRSSTLDLMRQVSEVDGPCSPSQRAFISKVTSFLQVGNSSGEWR